MLKKLFKYDFEASCRIFLLIYGIIAFLTVLGKIIFTLVPEGLENFPLISVLIPTYILLIIGLIAGFHIYLVVRFYRSLFTDEGYLYNTLPVKPWQLIASKLFVNVLLSLLGLLILILCGLILLAGSPMENLMKNSDEIMEIFRMLFGFTPGSIIFYVLLYFPVSLFSSFLMYFASIALGQVILPKHKVLGAFVSYMIYYVVMQTVTTIPVFAFTFSSTSKFLASGNDNIIPWMNNFYHFIYFFSFGLALVCSVVFFFITNYILQKKLNLD